MSEVNRLNKAALLYAKLHHTIRAIRTFHVLRLGCTGLGVGCLDDRFLDVITGNSGGNEILLHAAPLGSRHALGESLVRVCRGISGGMRCHVVG